MKILGLEKSELKYIGLAIGFALLWFLLILPYLVKTFDGNSLTQFLLFNIGLTVMLLFILKSLATGSSIPIKEAVGLLIVFIALDLFVPPYAVNFKGELLTGTMLSLGASDYFVGSLWLSLGIKGALLFIFTYIVSPFILLLIGGKLIKDFVRHI